MVHLTQLIDAIELCQTVLNKSDLADSSVTVSSVADLAVATKDQLAFVAHDKYLSDLQKTKAGVVLLSQKFVSKLPTLPNTLVIVVQDAYLAYASVSGLFAYTNRQIHPTAIIAPTAKIGKNASIGAYAVIGDFVEIGDDCEIGAHVVIHHHCVLGDGVQIHAHASIGAEGFGFAPKLGENGVSWHKIHQLGRVIIGNRVRIGASTCIDRGAVDDTIICDDVIIDNLVQIAHNVKIGAGTAIAGMVGIAGSATIGKGCVVGGGVGIAGHLTVPDFTTLTGRTFVAQSLEKSGSYSSGTVAMPTNEWRRAVVKFRQMGKH